MKHKELAIVRPMLVTMATLSERDSAAPPRSPDELATLRRELSERLRAMKAGLADYLTEREGYLALFPIVAFLDEVIMTRHLDAVGRGRWPLLQKEFFDTDSAGALFYDTLDEIIDSSQTNPLIHLVFYFCLSLGFLGKLVTNADRVEAYQRRLSYKLGVMPELPAHAEAAPTDDTGRLRLRGSYAWYYVAAAAVVASTYVLLSALATSA